MRNHTVTTNELHQFMKDTWTTFCSSASASPKSMKKMELSFDGRFKVIHNSTVVYQGNSGSDAIEVYNSI